MTPPTRQSLLGTEDDIAWRRTIPPEDRPPAMRVQVALAEALEREERLRERLAWAVEKLDECGKSVPFTLGMCRSLDDCRATLTTTGDSNA